MTAIRASRLSFAYEGRQSIFDDASFHLAPGFTGLVGDNGSGKTTLLRMLSGELRPDSGDLACEPADARIAVCAQTAPEVDAGVELLAWDPSRAACRLRGALQLVPETLARWMTLSPGERKRWQLGAALLVDPDVLLLDEPTNHLDARARSIVVAALRGFHGIGVLVSHDRELLSALTTHTLRVHRGRVRLHSGDYDAAREAWELEEAKLRDERASRVTTARLLARRVDAKRRDQASAEASTSSGARMKDRHDHDARGGLAKGRSAAAEKRVGRDLGVAREKLGRAEAAASAIRVEKTLGRAVMVGFQRSPHAELARLERDELRAGEEVLLRDLRLRVGREDRIWVQGDNGAGKSTLLAALAETSRHFWYVPQEPGAPPDPQELPPEARGRVLSMAAALGLSPDRLLSSRNPSPGESRKLWLAYGLGGHVAGMLLDEPTNHLDLASIERLESALEAFPGALVLVTHDARLATRVTRTTWEVASGGVTAR